MNNKNKKSCLFIKKIFFLILMLCFEKISFAVGKNRATQYIHYTHNKILSKRRKSQKNATDKNNKANKFHPLLLASGGDSGTISIWSNSFNFAKSENSEVDPRTGSLLVSVKAGLLLSNFGHGPDIDLEMNYNSSAKSNPDGLGHGWTWNLTHYNPVTHQLNTSAGKSFFLQQQSDGSWFPQYHKLKDVIITSKKGHLIITSANGLRDILNSDGYEIRLEQQNGEGVNFSYVPGSHLLQKITDDYGHSITLTRKDGYLIVTSYDVQGKPENVHISLNNNQVRNIWFPKNNNQQITDSSRVIHLSYGSNYYDQDLLTDIHYFTGMEKKFTYDCQYAMKLPAISNSKNSFHSFTPMCVVRQVEMIPGTNQPPMTINYRYTSVNSNDHDYLAYNSGLNEMPGLKTDLLFEAPASYTYKTEEDNGRVKVVRTYNKYHLLIDKKTISDQSGQLLYETKAYFCRTDTEDGCANTSFNQLPPTYSLPLKVVTTSWGENSSAPAVSVTKRSYDDNGRIISKTDSYGRRTEITYCPQYGDNHCPAAPHDWPVVSLKEGIKNFPASVKKGMQLSPVITSMYYKKEDNINKQGYTLVLYKKTVKHGTMQRTEIRQYYNNSSNHLTYGLLKQKELSGTNLPTSSVHKITHHYQYILNNNGTETISGYTDVVNHQPVLSKVIEKSLFFPKTLRVTSADKQNIHTFTYDEMGRVIARTDAVSTPFETTTHYQYTLSKDKNNVIVTTPDGMHKKIVFDGLGRILGTYIEKTDLQGHFQSGLWQQQTQTRYNAAGKVAEKTRYIDNGQNRGISAALTTYFDYDVLGRLTKKYLPDGETEVTQYDDAHRCIIHYTTDRQNHRTAVIIDRNNVTGKPVEKIILPATSGILPTVTTLCTRGDQQPNAKVSIMTYDGFDRLIKTEDPMGRIVQYRYDASGHISDTIDPVGDKLHNVYDLTGHIIQHEMIPAKGGDYLLASAGFNAA
ncbi:MAG: hypothetical protein OXC48_07790, partial [Endozoicomonadaceae bacterium]|nr:hypothetical protein [Endozoicomonadaceae bacterium]